MFKKGIIASLIFLIYSSNSIRISEYSENEILKRSIDFITERYLFENRKTFFLQFHLYTFDSIKSNFKYKLYRNFHQRDLLADNKLFYRSNGIIVTIDKKDSNAFPLKLNILNDSIGNLLEELQLVEGDSIVWASYVGSKFYVKYENDTLSGNVSGTPILFNRFDINKY
jgi:hypothetical protein